MRTKTLFCLLSVVLCVCASEASHIEETLTLERGWNAVYLESTPDETDLGAFFTNAPVMRVGAYVSDAYDDTAQYNSDGTERNQKPVSYKLWLRGERSTLTELAGGTAYLIYTTNAWSKTFYGIPQAPRFTWRKVAKTDTEAVVNLVGVSLAEDATPYAATYFKEGPYGTQGTVYTIGGTGDAPEFKAPFSTARSKIAPGKAYGATAESAGSWPGVLGVSSTSVKGGVYFGAGENTASVSLTNRGTTNRTVRITYIRSAKTGGTGETNGTGETLLPILRKVSVEGTLGSAWSNVVENAAWEVSLASGETTEFVFGIERATLDAAATYGGVLVFEDESGTGMRVRVPVRVAFPAENSADAAYPTGLWLGKFQFTGVTYDETSTPVTAEGTLKPTVMFFVDEAKNMTMLQRVSVVKDPTNATTRVFKRFDDAKAVSDSARRFSSLLLDPTNQLVAAKSGAFGNEVAFQYTVAPKSAGNPFYHVWHPDHDGKNATFDGDAKLGKELWSVTNTVTLQFRDLGTGSAYYSSDVDEIRAGRVLWQVDGLRSVPVIAEGLFSIQRLVPVKGLE